MQQINIAVPVFATDDFCSGIGQHIKAMLLQLPKVAPDNCQLIVFISHKDALAVKEKHERITIVEVGDFWSSAVTNIFWHIFILPLLMGHWRCDRALYLAGNRRLGWYKSQTSTAVIHDLSQLHVPDKYDALRMFYVLRCLPLLMQKIGKLSSVSSNTAQDVARWVKVNQQRIKVIHNGVNLKDYQQIDTAQARKSARILLHTKQPYIIYPARLEYPGKNHLRLLQAFASLKNSYGIPHKLVLVGKDWPGSAPIYECIKSLQLETDVILPGFVSSDDLAALITSADIMVFPSLYEGFGLPLVEAMAAGTLVCAANCSSIPEVVGEQALLFDPYKASDIRRVLLHGLYNNHEQLVLMAKQRSLQFTWKKSAQSLLTLCLSKTVV